MSPTVSNAPGVVYVTDVAGTPAQVYVPAPESDAVPVGDGLTQTYVTETTSTVVVSPVGLPGPRGDSLRVLGRLPAGTLPNAFPLVPAPRVGDSWTVGGTALWTWSGLSWQLTFEVPTVATYSEDFALSDSVKSLSVPVQHGLGTERVSVETQLLPDGHFVTSEVAVLSANTVAVTLSTAAPSWNATALRVQVRP